MTGTGHAEDPGTAFAARLAGRIAEYGERPCIEFEQRWYSGTEITTCIDAVDHALTRAGIGPGERVGIVVRNRVPHAAAVLGFVAARRPVAMINSYQSPGALAADVERLGLSAVLAAAKDWSEPVRAACVRIGGAGIALTTGPGWVETVVPGDPSARRPGRNEPGLHILTSGTTGPPKRVPIGTAALAHTVLSMTGGLPAAPDDPPELVYWPFGSIGICQLLAAPYQGKRMILLEKFAVRPWVRAVKTYRIRRTGVQPTILRMLLDADVAPEDLSSLEYLPGGSGPLDPELRAEFERRFGVVLLWAYGATEFAGSVCAWTPDLYREFGAGKAGSVGRPLPGVEVRILDPETGDEVSAGERGVLAARVEAVGPDFLRTTDLASMDADGFVTVYGRADGAINRGGFKILPESVRAVLLRHPGVRDACVVGVPHRRLGQVPFAAVELRRERGVADSTELRELVREALPSHHVPVDIVIVDELPRNAAMKVRTDAVAALYQES